MDGERDGELENSESWDYERPEVREPVKASRVVVSVAFQRDVYARVSEYAEHTGKKISEFIREAAIEKATGKGGGALVYGSGSLGTLWWGEQMPNITRVSGSPVEYPEKVAATTH
jgi:hypothetical protein